ncbi:[formate-C-acetyltransferase]-activating enzyme [Clostridium estertheticum]|uniref:[formate-C-acetyltransferase]-activating enzyme n=1 Tax=Clostridium estertheticum subsp. estertheticum TaxID=1552 RepID=A0A1J0GGC4_9CLOT|nr:[formate-C-acetyltransferase]-activating enzyme [Clostridium estertheticum]APC39958.1 [formate-C-acetyltransferase]-activating enzyme [Clostridium estertheticum subsp. estertheticum]MBZ9613968.1 [formate-C-acetyltransferase]-activating enzyme [Clostridium estertheticum subsp. laramiense]WAG73926.1 [formate-C-acetyltransferase]-activating enzyme [Clostridium estertheticum]
MKALILNIQRYSLHDGSGIRTIVFFKGCPLKCPWCSNPESISFQPQTVKMESKCIHCQHCSFDVDECPTGAITQFGKYMTVEEVVTEVQKDMIFYRTSKGGVTLSGGEVLSQSAFAIELLKQLKSLGINTAIETSGQGSTQNLIELATYLDLILFDLKIMNKEKAKLILGSDINLIKNNIKTLVKMHKKIIPRVPLIPGYTADDENIKEIIAFVKSLNLTEIHLLPFHQYGSNKYKLLNLDYKLNNIDIPTPESIEKIANEMRNNDLNVVVGGL